MNDRLTSRPRTPCSSAGRACTDLQRGGFRAAAAAAFALVITGLVCLPVRAPAASSDALARARSALEAGNAIAAIQRLTVLLETDPADPDARLLLNEALLDAGQPAAAAASLRTMVEAEERTQEAGRLLLRALLEQGKHADVLDFTEPGAPGTTILPMAEVLTFRGEALAAQGLLRVAEQSFDAARTLDGDAAGPLLGLVAVARQQGDRATARALLQDLRESHPDSWRVAAATGDLAFAEERFAHAAIAYSLALSLRPAYWSLRYRRALARVESDDTEGAERDLTAIRSLVPGFAGLDYVEGRLALERGDPSTAIVSLRTFLRAAPTEQSALFYLGSALFQAQRHAEAEQVLSELLTSAPGNLSASLLLARTLLARGDATGAEAVLTPLTDIAQPLPEAVALQRRALLAQGRARDAAVLLERAEQAKDASVPGRLLRAQRAVEAGEPGQARALLESVIADRPRHPGAYALLLRVHLLMDDLAAAEETARAQARADPASAAGPLNHAFIASLRGQPAVARMLLKQALAAEPERVDAAIALAALELRQGHTAAARAALEPVLARDPGNVQVILALAEIDRRGADQAAYAARLLSGINANPEALLLRLALAHHLLGEGRAADALELLQQAPDRQQTEPAWMFAAVQAMDAAGQPQAATAMLESLAAVAPSSAPVRYRLAILSARRGKIGAAEEHLFHAMLLEHGDALMPAALREVLARCPSHAECKALVQRLLGAAPNHPGLLLGAAEHGIRTGDFDRAVAAYRTLIRQAPERVDYRVGLADALARDGAREHAVELLTELVDQYPQDIPSRMLLAKLHLLAQQSRSAEALYREVLALDPRDVTALNNLAMLIAEIEPDQAVAYARQAVSLAPEDKAILDTLGTALLAAGNATEAAVALERAHRGFEHDPAFGLRLAQALARAGEAERAREVLSQLANISFPEQDQATSLLRSLENP